MSIPAKCTKCDHTWTPQGLFKISGNPKITMVDCRTACPKCGGPAEFQSGTYEYTQGILSAFTAPGMTREKVLAAKEVAKNASDGSINSDDAIEQLRQINSQLAEVVQKSAEKRIPWEFIVTVLMCIYTIWADQKSDADAQALLEEVQTQTEITEKLLEELEKQSDNPPPPQPKTQTQPLIQKEMTVAKNRDQRRKDAAIARRNGKSRDRSV